MVCEISARFMHGSNLELIQRLENLVAGAATRTRGTNRARQVHPVCVHGALRHIKLLLNVVVHPVERGKRKIFALLGDAGPRCGASRSAPGGHMSLRCHMDGFANVLPSADSDGGGAGMKS